MLNRSDIRSDPSDGVVRPGLPLNLAINLHEIRGSACSPLSSAQVTSGSATRAASTPMSK